MKILSVSVGEASHSSLKEQPEPAEAGEAAYCSKRSVLRTGAENTQAARTTLRWIFEDRSAPEEGVCRAHSTDERSGYMPEQKQRAQLCDGFSRIDTLPKKECAGRTRLMRKRIYAQTARQGTEGTGYLSAIRSFFPAPAIRSL